MKIYDIIATNEGLWDIPVALGKKVIAPAVKQAAQKLKPTAAKISSKAEKKAAQTAAVDADLKIVGTVLGDKAASLTKIFYTLGIGLPMVNTALELAKLNKKLAAGSISKEQYDGELRYWCGKCVTEILAIGAFRAALATGGAIIRTVPFPGTGALANLIGKMSPITASAYGAWLATPGPLGGQEAFTKWFIGKSFLDSVAEFSRDWLGSWAATGYEKLMGKAQEIDPATGKPVAADKATEPPSGNVAAGPSQLDKPQEVERDYYTGARLK